MRLAVGRNDLGELFDESLRVFDGTGEGDGATHVCHVALQISFGGSGLVKSLGQSVPAAGDVNGIVKIQFIVRIGNLALEGFGDVFFIHGQDQHFVVGEQGLADGFAETEAVELLAEQRGVIHRAEFSIGFRLWSWCRRYKCVAWRSCRGVFSP